MGICRQGAHPDFLQARHLAITSSPFPPFRPQPSIPAHPSLNSCPPSPAPPPAKHSSFTLSCVKKRLPNRSSSPPLPLLNPPLTQRRYLDIPNRPTLSIRGHWWILAETARGVNGTCRPEDAERICIFQPPLLIRVNSSLLYFLSSLLSKS